MNIVKSRIIIGDPKEQLIMLDSDQIIWSVEVEDNHLILRTNVATEGTTEVKLDVIMYMNVGELNQAVIKAIEEQNK